MKINENICAVLIIHFAPKHHRIYFAEVRTVQNPMSWLISRPIQDGYFCLMF
jgi:hypothetical protein